jgi:hypothetical protein
MLPSSLETRLADALKPSAAPAELWTRVSAELEASKRARPSAVWPRFLMAAALAVLTSGGVLYLRAEQARSFADTAVALHRGADRSGTQAYGVQRYVVNGEAITVVSAPASTAAVRAKMIRTATFGTLAVSAWTFDGRYWALVSTAAQHKQACTVCHRA